MDTKFIVLNVQCSCTIFILSKIIEPYTSNTFYGFTVGLDNLPNMDYLSCNLD